MPKIKSSDIGCLLFKEPNDWIQDIIRGKALPCKLGIHTAVSLYELHYTDGIAESGTFVISRYRCVKELYYRWCALKGHNPNPNEGWFKSKRFNMFLNKIEYMQANYAIMLLYP